jgi:hypothetical protein
MKLLKICKIWGSHGSADANQGLLDYNLELFQQMVTVRFFQNISRVEWLNSEQTNVLRIIYVLILMDVMWLGIQSVIYTPIWALCLLLPTGQWRLLGGIECPLWLSSLDFFLWSFFKHWMLSFSSSLWSDVWSGAFLANGYNEVLSGCQLGRVVEQWTNLCFEDHLCPHPQSCDVTGYPAHHLCTCPSCVCCWPLANGDCWMGLSVRSDRPDHTSLHRKEKKLDIQCLKKLQKKKSRLLSQSGHSILSNSLQWLAGNNKHAAQTGI